MTPRDALNALLRAQLGPFTRQAFATVAQGRAFQRNWHVDAIVHHLEEVAAGRIRRLVITLPPRNAKTHCATVAFPAWLLGRYPTARIICASYGQPLAVEFANQCRHLVGAPWYRDAFPDTVLSPTKNTQTEFQTTRGGSRLATSVGGVLTGRGGDFIVIDDPIKPEDAHSETVRTSTNEWYDHTVLSRLDDKTRGAIVVVMQRLHVDDLAGHLLERGGWTHLNLPAIAEVDEAIPIGRGRVHRRRVGDVLHPEREPMAVLEELRRSLGSAAFAAQYQQTPVPAGGNTFKARWFGRFAALGREDEDLVYQSWDTACKTGELNDASVCTTWLVRRNAFHLVDVYRDRLDFPDLRRKVVELARRWRAEAVLIEDKASGQSLIQDLAYTGEVYAIAINPEGDKVMRAHVATPQVEAGRVLLPVAASWLGEFENEVLAFPNGRHDDQVDSMVQFLNWAKHGVDHGPRIRSFDD